MFNWLLIMKGLKWLNRRRNFLLPQMKDRFSIEYKKKISQDSNEQIESDERENKYSVIEKGEQGRSPRQKFEKREEKKQKRKLHERRKLVSNTVKKKS